MGARTANNSHRERLPALLTSENFGPTALGKWSTSFAFVNSQVSFLLVLVSLRLAATFKMDWSDQESTFQRWRRSSSAKCTVIGLVLLLVVAFFLFPTSVSSGSSQLDSQYAVVIDAGSSGSRVHVYEVRKHDGSYDVVDELFEQLKPGLSAFKDDPKAAAASLDPLLQKAAERVPPELHSQTAIGLGATAGLRMIGEAKASKILYAVRDHITSNYDFPIRHENDIRILDGNEEGKYAWIAVNTLLGQVGQDPSETYAACDLGGGSVQCMFAMPGDSASLRKGNPTQKDMPAGYVEKVTGGGRSYNLYVHSFLGYGLLAARMAVLDATPNAAAACMPADFTGEYTYGDKSVPASGRGTASFNSCRMAVQAALKTDKPCNDNVAPASECPIDGQWAGGLAKLLEKSPQFKVCVSS